MNISTFSYLFFFLKQLHTCWSTPEEFAYLKFSRIFSKTFRQDIRYSKWNKGNKKNNAIVQNAPEITNLKLSEKENLSFLPFLFNILYIFIYLSPFLLFNILYIFIYLSPFFILYIIHIYLPVPFFCFIYYIYLFKSPPFLCNILYNIFLPVPLPG